MAGSTSTAEVRPSTGRAEEAIGGPNQDGAALEKGRGGALGARMAMPGSARAAAGGAGLNRGWAGAPGSARSGRVAQGNHESCACKINVKIKMSHNSRKST